MTENPRDSKKTQNLEDPWGLPTVPPSEDTKHTAPEDVPQLGAHRHKDPCPPHPKGLWSHLHFWGLLREL